MFSSKIFNLVILLFGPWGEIVSETILDGLKTLSTQQGDCRGLCLADVRFTHCLKNVTPIIQSQCNRFKSDLYEPDYLISMEPDEPVYDCLNLQLKGYDYVLLESCQKEIHRYAEIMGLQVEDSWATPAQQLKVVRYKPGSTALESEYKLNIYERNVQVADVPAWALGTLLRVSRALLPQGCTLNVLEHAIEHEEIRYVPDGELINLKQQLDDMGGPRVEKKKRK